MKPLKRRLMLAILMMSCCIGCDQATKSIATHSLQNAAPKSYLGDTVRLDYALNPGGFLSLGSRLPDSVRQWLFVAFNSFAMIGLAIYLGVKRDLPLPVFVALVLILAGGIGNLIDRIGNHGLVTDFINLGVGPVRTGIFNVADIAVTLGALMIVYFVIRTPEPFQPRIQKPADAVDESI